MTIPPKNDRILDDVTCTQRRGGDQSSEPGIRSADRTEIRNRARRIACSSAPAGTLNLDLGLLSSYDFFGRLLCCHVCSRNSVNVCNVYVQCLKPYVSNVSVLWLFGKHWT